MAKVPVSTAQNNNRKFQTVESGRQALTTLTSALSASPNNLCLKAKTFRELSRLIQSMLQHFHRLLKRLDLLSLFNDNKMTTVMVATSNNNQHPSHH